MKLNNHEKIIWMTVSIQLQNLTTVHPRFNERGF